MDDQRAEDRARRARRLAWAFRLTVYPAAVALAVVLLAGRGDATITGTLHGTTSQDRGIEIDLDDDGRPVGIETEFTVWCPNGESPRYR